MITFVTILLGLVFGTYEVEVAVDDSVVRVEFLLDGEIIGELSQPPWKAELDLGDALEPHRLEAVAYDTEGRETSRTDQILNLPRPQSEITLAIRLDPAGATSRFDVNWNTVLGLEPQAVNVFFDGAPLEAHGLRDLALPPYNPQQLHLLQVELELSANQVASAEATFGGVYAEAVSSELTAIALKARDDQKRPPTLKDSLGLQLAEKPAVPVAIERGIGEFIVVRAQNSRPHLEQLIAPPGQRVIFIELAKKKEVLRLVGSVPQKRFGPRGVSNLFPTSTDLEAFDGRLGSYLAFIGWQERKTEVEEALPQAVAVAGLTAVELNRRRIVVVVLGAPSDEESREILEEVKRVRHYLHSLGVPMHVWTTHPAEWQEIRHGWGDIVDITGKSKLQRAVRAARNALDAQTIAWFEGSHLPQEFVFSAQSRFEVAR